MLGYFKESLEVAHHSQNQLEEALIRCKDELVETLDCFFERANEPMDFFHPSLDLNGLYLFKLVMDGQILDEEDVAPNINPSLEDRDSFGLETV